MWNYKEQCFIPKSQFELYMYDVLCFILNSPSVL